VARNVASLVRVPKVKAVEIEILMASDIEALVRGLAGHRLLPIALTALGSGLRRGELCALRWCDLDLDRSTLRVELSLEETRAGLKLKEPKTVHGKRRMSLPATTVAALRAHRTAELERRLQLGLGRPASADPVFTLEDGSHWGPN